LQIERSTDEDAIPPETINDVFRSMHTLKGLSGMLGLTGISDLSHSLENLLDKVRLGKVKLHQGTLDALYAGVELLSKIVGAVGAPAPRRRRHPPRRAADPAAAGGEARRPPEVTLENVDLDKAHRRHLTEYEEHRLLENVRAGRSLCRVGPFSSKRSTGSAGRSPRSSK
jgi:two-component system chemotaxis sensor kinase CheA